VSDVFADTSRPPPRSSWPAGIASLIFSASTVFFFALYSHVHWAVLARHYAELAQLRDLKDSLFVVLGRLEFYRLFGVFAVAWALWALRGRPRWLGWIALPISVFALFLAVVIQ
jgi:hypothetical protein